MQALKLLPLATYFISLISNQSERETKLLTNQNNNEKSQELINDIGAELLRIDPEFVTQLRDEYFLHNDIFTQTTSKRGLQARDKNVILSIYNNPKSDSSKPLPKFDLGDFYGDSNIPDELKNNFKNLVDDYQSNDPQTRANLLARTGEFLKAYRQLQLDISQRPTSQAPTRMPTPAPSFAMTFNPTDATITLSPADSTNSLRPTTLPTIIISEPDNPTKSPIVQVINPVTNPPTSQTFTFNPTTSVLNPATPTQSRAIDDTQIYGIAGGSVAALVLAAIAYYNRENIKGLFATKKPEDEELGNSRTGEFGMINPVSATEFRRLEKRVVGLEQTQEELREQISGISGVKPNDVEKIMSAVNGSRGFLVTHTKELEEMAIQRRKSTTAQTELELMLQDEKAREYYLDVIRLLNGIYVAALSVDSGWINIGAGGKIGALGTILKIAGGFSPVAGNAISTIGELTQMFGKEIQKNDLIKFAQLCSSPANMDNIAKAVALALVQNGRTSKTGNEAGADVAKMLKSVFESKEIVRNAQPRLVATQFVEAAMEKKVSRIEVAPYAILVSTVSETTSLALADIHNAADSSEEQKARVQSGKQRFAATQKRAAIDLKNEVLVDVKSAITELAKDGAPVTPKTVISKIQSPQRLVMRELTGSEQSQISKASPIVLSIIQHSNIIGEELENVALALQNNLQNKEFRKLLINNQAINPVVFPIQFGQSLGRAISSVKDRTEKSISGAVNEWVKAEIGKSLSQSANRGRGFEG